MKELGKKNTLITIPNLLSLLRIFLIYPIITLYFQKEYLYSCFLLTLSGITDIIDGYIARKFNMMSELGKILDPIADKLTQTILLMFLLLSYPLMICPIITLLIKETFMAITGYMIIKKKNIILGASWHGKLTTFFLYTTMFLHILWVNMPSIVSILSILISTIMIVISFFLYGQRNLRHLYS